MFMNLKIIFGFMVLLAVFFGSWLFAWPFVEGWYTAGSGWWNFMVENYFMIPHKLNLFLLGALLFFGGMYAGIRVVVT
jgi:hypothetical protein